MTISRKTLSFVASMAAVSPAVCAADADKAWPTHHVRIIVPISAGSTTDTAARLFADGLAKRWGQPVVVENRSGADTHIATAEFIKARDDHTLLWGIPSAFTINPLLLGIAPYDPQDLVPISATASPVRLVMVHTGVPARSLGDLARLARAEPGRLLWGAPPGIPRYVFAAFLRRQSLDMPYVPYRDFGSALIDLGEGRLQVWATAGLGAIGLVQSGKARIIAVLEARRVPMLPEVATAAEAGYPEMATIDGFMGLFGWRDIPAALRDKIAGEVQAIAKEPVVRSRLEAMGQVALGTTPAEFAAAIEKQRLQIGELARLIDLKTATSK